MVSLITMRPRVVLDSRKSVMQPIPPATQCSQRIACGMRAGRIACIAFIPQS
jgi:hypothetical protein